MAKDTLDQLLRGHDEHPAWEVYHEASKSSEYDRPVSAEVVQARMTAMWPSFPYDGYPTVRLPLSGRLNMALTDAVSKRETALDICATQLSLDQVATLLFHTYGETHDKTELGFPRRFRAVPSGGALYPLEIYLHSTRIVGLGPGIYHYNPCDHAVRRIIDGDRTDVLSAALVQGRLASDSGMLVFVTAVAERSTFKYGEPGYRFMLLEAGHAAQNFVLAATALGLGAVTVGGYFDRIVDQILNIDGLDQSTLYVMAVGARSGVNWVG